MTDRHILIAYFGVTAVCALGIAFGSVARASKKSGEPSAMVYLEALMGIPMAIGAALMWPLGLVTIVLAVVMKALGFASRSKR